MANDGERKRRVYLENNTQCYALLAVATLGQNPLDLELRAKVVGLLARKLEQLLLLGVGDGDAAHVSPVALCTLQREGELTQVLSGDLVEVVTLEQATSRVDDLVLHHVPDAVDVADLVEIHLQRSLVGTDDGGQGAGHEQVARALGDLLRHRQYVALEALLSDVTQTLGTMNAFNVGHLMDHAAGLEAHALLVSQDQREALALRGVDTTTHAADVQTDGAMTAAEGILDPDVEQHARGQVANADLLAGRVLDGELEHIRIL